MKQSLINGLAGLAITALISGCATSGNKGNLEEGSKGRNWYKGNTHTHTLWSDGDAAPEWAVAWYKEHGYDFLSITDHNTLLRGNKDVLVGGDSKLSEERLALLHDKFGHDHVELKTRRNGTQEMQLKTLEELREIFEVPNEFLLVEGEEITGRTHVNGINVRKKIHQSKADNNLDSMREQIRAVNKQSKKTHTPMFAHLDHPNFSQAIAAEDIIKVTEGRYFEIYNGHGGVRNWGSEALRIPDTDRKWDIILTHRLLENPDNILYGVATDDTHTYFETGAGHSIPGRGWSMVLADRLTPRSLVRAYLRGDFYASAGVMLKTIDWDDESYTVATEPEAGVTFTTQFIGTRKGVNLDSKPALDDDGNEMSNRTRIYDDAVGEILYSTTDNPATYTFQGDEIYVRAKVISTKLKDQPFQEGDVELAWTQPVVRVNK
jgi:hypothetical protein